MGNESLAPMPAGSTPDAQKAIMDNLVQTLLKRVSAPQAGGMRQPTPQFSPDSMQKGKMDYSTAENSQQDAGIALHNFGTFIHNQVAQHKQNQMRDAMSEWQGFDNALQKAQALAGDPSAPDYQEKIQKVLGQDPWVKANLDPSNPKAVKRLKNMYKALNVDLTSDDKENVHRQGLQQMFKVKSAFQKVLSAKGKMDAHKQQQQGQGQPQQTDPAKRTEQFQQSLGKLMSQETIRRPDLKEVNEAARTATEAAKAGMDKYEFKQGVDPATGKPTWFSFDKTRPEQPPKRMEIEGKAITTEGKFSKTQEGKVLSMDTKPYGVIGKGGSGVLTPGDPEWGETEQRHLDQANQAWAKGEAGKAKLAGIRAQTYINSREYAVYNTKTGTLEMANPNKINAAPPGTYAPATGAMQTLTKEAVFKDIYYNVNNVDEAAKNLKHGFSAAQRAQFIVALRSTDPANSFSTFLSSQAAPKEQDQIDYLTAIASLSENAMAIRSVANLGTGSDQLREAILRTVPGAGTPSYKYLKTQLDRFKGTAQRLETAVPKLGSGDVVTDPKDLN